MEACRFLKQKYGIQPILTSGSLLRNGNVYIHQSKEEIAGLLRNGDSNVGLAKFHTWLTLANYVLDITIMTTEWLIDETRGDYRYPCDKYCQIIALDYMSRKNKFFSYHPVFLGEDYFNHVRFIPKEHKVIFNPDPKYPENIR